MKAESKVKLNRGHEALVEVGAFLQHTLATYICALYLSPWLIGRWFGWFLPIMRISPVSIQGDFYLQHLELISFFPALAAGYAATRFINRKGSVWAFTAPVVLLLYKMTRFDAPHSVLTNNSMSALRYYFDIMRVMPTRVNFLTSDPERVLAQEFFTAPFYAGVAYSLGAWESREKLLTRLFTFERPGD